MEGDEFVLYNTSSGNFYKCKKCHQKYTKLRNFQPTEIYKRIVGYMSPTKQWNAGKREEERDRKEYKLL